MIFASFLWELGRVKTAVAALSPFQAPGAFLSMGLMRWVAKRLVRRLQSLAKWTISADPFHLTLAEMLLLTGALVSRPSPDRADGDVL